MPSATLAMALPTIEVVIRDGVPVFMVSGMGLCTAHSQLWQARTHWEALCVAAGHHPCNFPADAAGAQVVDGDGGRWGEAGT